MTSYDVTAVSGARPESVYRLLTVGATWPEWSPIDAVRIEGGGDAGSPQGVGATRVFRTGRNESHEEIVELVPDRRMVYVMRSGAFRTYRATVDLAPVGQGTRIHWYGSFRAPRGTGWLWRLYLTWYMRRMVNGLAAYPVT
ncbi:SRPBCC family protein [Plantactinospora soyae]|uniref:Uncharacterized protein YndB with AHSA1/START domain n=1 Tax=Plantactinospora soyae TaxID=1544732 RepID=A0A927MA09_9ACTN|nr:SRPBCC family protein [Plantactinospora soyae]MBE1490747.1 uncharacterized protein YndB with AHSA1/START domain [Plantactinospora soyae]